MNDQDATKQLAALRAELRRLLKVYDDYDGNAAQAGLDLATGLRKALKVKP